MMRLLLVYILVLCSLLVVLFPQITTAKPSELLCSLRQFSCSNKKCIPVSYVCDEEADCEDGSDEDPALCSNSKNIACADGEFKCSNIAKCIPVSFVCDEEADCEDGSDEDPALCSKWKKITCADGEFKCSNNAKCIPGPWQCDNEKDCNDGSDEDEQICRNKRCGTDKFTCRDTSGQCVPLIWKCDGNKDCSDGSDEWDCNKTCRSDEFTCANGVCIPKRWTCDSDNDCGDNSDEKGCPPKDIESKS